MESHKALGIDYKLFLSIFYADSTGIRRRLLIALPLCDHRILASMSQDYTMNDLPYPSRFAGGPEKRPQESQCY